MFLKLISNFSWPCQYASIEPWRADWDWTCGMGNRNTTGRYSFFSVYLHNIPIDPARVYQLQIINGFHPFASRQQKGSLALSVHFLFDFLEVSKCCDQPDQDHSVMPI